jgi:hypothetical protein
MIRAFSIVCFLPLILLPRPVRGCQCMLALSTCNEIGASDLVFIGTVELIQPMFLNRWNLTSPAYLKGAGQERSREASRGCQGAG